MTNMLFDVPARADLDFSPIAVYGNTTEEVWKEFMRACLERGRKYTVEEGSHAGDYRLTMDCAIGCIRYPEVRPLAPLPNEGQIPPTDDRSIQEYFETKVFSDAPPAPGEHYNYSEWLYPLAMAAIEYYGTKGFGNAHVTMRVGDPLCFLDYFQPTLYVTDASGKRHVDETARKTTPCLLGIDTRVILSDNPVTDSQGVPVGPYFLTFYVMYRSWDLFGGFPENMAGFQLLKETMAREIAKLSSMNVRPGPSVVFCKDLHLYGSRIEAARAWVGM